jgi:hypothetical protein
MRRPDSGHLKGVSHGQNIEFSRGNQKDLSSAGSIRNAYSERNICQIHAKSAPYLTSGGEFDLGA